MVSCPPAARITSPVLVGRAGELDALVRLVTHPPALALVDGEAGVGKTRLLHELASRRELVAFRVLTGQCVRLREPFPYAPLVGALATLAGRRLPARPLSPVTGVLRPLLPELGDWLPAAPVPHGDAAVDRHRMFRAVRELLVALGPTVLVLDDLHWLDQASFELLGFLLRSLPVHLSVVVSARGEDVTPGLAPAALGERLPPGAAYLAVTLHPLPVDAVSGLAAAILRNRAVSREFAVQLHERTSGLPFAVEEVLGSLADPRVASSTSARRTREALRRLAVPGSVREPVRERLDRLGPAARSVVAASAVLDLASGEDVLAAVAGLPVAAVADALAEALDHALLHPVGPTRYEFRHMLAREAVYDALPHPRRRRLHTRAERVLRTATPAPYAKLAQHARAAGRYRASLRYAETAADLAADRGDNATATELLREALETPRLPKATSVRLTVKLARAASLGLDHAEAIPLLRAAVADGALPTGSRGEVRLNLGLLLSNQAGEVAAGTEQIRRSVAELRRRPELAARALSGLAVPDHTDGPVGENLAWLGEALRLLPKVTDPGLRAAILVNNATTLLTIGDPAAWAAIAELPEPGRCAATREQLSRGACNFTNNCTQLGHYAAARRFLRQALRFAEDPGGEFIRLLRTSFEVELNWATGEWCTLADQARLLAGQAGLPAMSRLGLTMSGILALLAGEAASAIRRLRAARVPAELMAWHRGDGLAVAWLARALIADGQAAAAAAEVDSALRVIRSKGVWVWAGELAPAAVAARLACGEPAAAGELVEEFAAGLVGRDCPLGAAAVAWCRAMLAEAEGRPAAAESYLTARARYAALPRPYEAAVAAEAAARCAEATGGLPAADGLEYLRTALREYERLAARADAHRCRRQLRTAGVAVPARRGRPRYGRELSPREREVLDLLGRGSTNREIAARLYLSERTVEGHLARLRAKLGVRSRRELREQADPATG